MYLEGWVQFCPTSCMKSDETLKPPNPQLLICEVRIKIVHFRLTSHGSCDHEINTQRQHVLNITMVFM